VRLFFCVPALAAAVSILHGQTTLKVSDPVISQFEDGPPVGGQKLVVGESVFFRFGVLGYKTGEGGKVHLTGHAQVFDARGVAIAPVDEVAIGTSLRDEDKDWKPRLHSQFQLPGLAPPGTYKVKFDATDEQTHQSASGEAVFAVDGKNVAASGALVIRGFGFFHTADDETPLKVAAYRAGDMVWVKFDITGYKYGEQNAIDVAYDVAVTAAEGRTLFTQENAAVEKSQAFYPQPWVPGNFSLTLQPNMTPGMYAVSITARDGVGNQTVTEKAPFRVE